MNRLLFCLLIALSAATVAKGDAPKDTTERVEHSLKSAHTYGDPARPEEKK